MQEQFEQSLNFNFQEFLQIRNESLLRAFMASISTLVNDIPLQDWLVLLLRTNSEGKTLNSTLRCSILFVVITNMMREAKEMTNHTGCIVCAFYLLDAAINQLPNFSVSFYCNQPIYVYLRQLKIYLSIPQASVVNVSLSNDILLIKFSGMTKEIQLAADNTAPVKSLIPFDIICKPLSGLPHEQFNNIDTSISLIAFENLIVNSLSTLQCVDQPLHQSLSSLIDSIVPIKSPESDLKDKVNHSSSFSLSNHIGAIFLSFLDNQAWFLETLVHEFAHNLLNILMLSCSLIADQEKVFYSPWKEKPRPAYGLLHALFAFTHVESLLTKLLPSADPHSKAFIESRLLTNSHQLKLAFDQPLLNSLTNKGKKVYEILRETFSSVSSNFLCRDCPKIILEHKAKFMK